MADQLGVFRSLKMLAGYRQRVLEGVVHDIRQRYIGSVFGSLWALLFPLLQLGIYAGLYSVVFKVRPSGLTEAGYVILVFSGLVPLMAFNEAMTAAASSLSSHKNLLLNTVFPAELIPLRAALAAQITSIFGLVITLIAGFSLGRTSWQAVLLVPVFWILLLMFAMGIGWMLSLLSLVARDIQHGLGLVTMLLFVLSPFAYTPEMVPQALKPLLYLNPMSYYVMTFQQLICYGTWPDPVHAGGAVLLGLTSFFIGFSVFRRAKHVFFDYA
ncbi:ABC transporter permease [Bordetella hinzii]|uniref:Transport permease protein n=1 Tax=Bordetella hinzii OH87 BAL007II TaxID=1331262 RepID=A0ABR4QZ20_9BORD|nr:ABC transporter permease [Bordetella hinzii]AKQ53453.1 Teichoic acid translocation permease protein TagG [Bordetella hinzii]KCB23198.1 ABC transporter, ATP-binding protein [Bordetella hinzii OH87 BAL007II]KCB28803.1 ABC transporter, ATP-binding protein [Bordetella hinzii CA90 BAL1384]KCB29519.1 ABC transporter, ATP-binding protein [Bordetella hinzii L60]KCB42700.1 ABC transporter, ATP-binding protein [Bordetella hinzii 5132]